MCHEDRSSAKRRNVILGYQSQYHRARQARRAPSGIPTHRDDTIVRRRVVVLRDVDVEDQGVVVGEAGDDLVGDVRAQVDAEGESEVVKTNDITELFAACELGPRMSENERDR